MKNKDKKIVRLLEEGLSYELVKRMSDGHIERIYRGLVKEASTYRVPAEKIKDIENDIPDDATVEVTEDDVDNIKPFKGKQTQDPKQVGPSSDDGMDEYQDGMDEEVKVEKKKLKTPITTLGMFEAKKKKEKYNPWAVCTSSLGLEGKKREDYTEEESKKFERCVKDVKKQESNENVKKIRKIDESLISLLSGKNVKMFTKKNIMDTVSEDVETAPAPVRTPSKEPSPTRRRRPTPNVKPKPKAGDREETMPDWFTLSSIMSAGETETSPAPVITPTEEPSPTRRKRRPTPNIKPKPKARR